jgi:calcium-dependent protein kinase
MGNKGSAFTKTQERVEAKAGKIPLSARYHRDPRKIEDDYDIQSKVLGSGYNGVVRLATSKTNADLKFAVKAFKLSNVVNEKRQQLEAEVEIFLTLDHPHVTRLFDVYEAADHLFLVMECMEGGELFDRIHECKRFAERDAADAVWQMLLALNYIHSHGIVHRDLKLENFLYDKKDSNHLKLIDFGFSKAWDPNIKMHVSCGTLSYVAPEVLEKSYTSQCDLWSLGVIAFILLAGYMPFSGSEQVQTSNISQGKYNMRPEKWSKVSQPAKHFVQSLLQVNPEKRLTAQAALEHQFIAKRSTEGSAEVDTSVVDALRQFGQASKFRRCCMEMMAWSLSNEERAKVRQYFVSMDNNKQGTITLVELKKVLTEKFSVPSEETEAIFNALDSNNDEEIHYSDFLAAMVSTRIALHDDLLKAAFKKFDTDNSGYITVENLREVLGDQFEGQEVEKLLAEADQLHDNRISYPEFVSYLRGDPLSDHGDAAAKIIDQQLLNKDRSSGKTSENLWGITSAAMPRLRMKSDRPSTAGSDKGGTASTGSQKGAGGKAQTGNGASQGCCVIH